jgi:hypothetical protein
MIEQADDTFSDSTIPIIGITTCVFGQPKDIAGADNGRQIAGFVDLIGQHTKIWLAGVQGLFDSDGRSGGHGI